RISILADRNGKLSSQKNRLQVSPSGEFQSVVIQARPPMASASLPQVAASWKLCSEVTLVDMGTSFTRCADVGRFCEKRNCARRPQPGSFWRSAAFSYEPAFALSRAPRSVGATLRSSPTREPRPSEHCANRWSINGIKYGRALTSFVNMDQSELADV